MPSQNCVMKSFACLSQKYTTAPKDRDRISFIERITQLYEQGAEEYIGQYVHRFAGWIREAIKLN